MELSRRSQRRQRQMHRFEDSESPTPPSPPEGGYVCNGDGNGGIWRSNGVTACKKGGGKDVEW